MPLQTVVLVACVGKKTVMPCAAKELYQSVWFVKARQYAEQLLTQDGTKAGSNNGSGWYILSAEHHLLEPDKLTAPYNKTLNTMPIGERREWAERVYQQLRQVTDPSQHRLVFLAGERYRQPLSTMLADAGYKVEVPMLGLGIGQQLAWLGKNTHY